ncbi:WxL domain-containing protein [Enterococcus termitis]|uniref:WxL domain-containing protein n=1 Tax=Enterococcus termitis TaxID=332950 RepID=UPI00090FAD0B|nr:WxL domain-containing protein [Enterococcus termitis]OJG96724.1 hypothetical protein RV18_GL001930 [Enterococcus termitis]
MAKKISTGFIILSMICLAIIVKAPSYEAIEDGGAIKSEGVVTFVEKTPKPKESGSLPKAGEKGISSLSYLGLLVLFLLLVLLSRYPLKGKHQSFWLLFLLSISCIFGNSTEANGFSESSVIEFDKKVDNYIYDPEFPTEIVDPGTSEAVGRYLRMEFASRLDFGINEQSDKNETYYSKGQLFYGSTPARGNFIQVSDLREHNWGWGLYVKQETQFSSKEEHPVMLDGAKITLKQPWINSTILEHSPRVNDSEIELVPGQLNQLVHASAGEGVGTWLLSFGASSGNENGQKNSLIPKYDDRGQMEIDTIYQKNVYLNKAVTLNVPGKTKKQNAVYQTDVTWILSELP